MHDFPKRVLMREEGAREGFQSESRIIPTEEKVRLIDALSGTGVRLMQVASFVHPKWVPQMADAEEVVARITMVPGVRYFGAYLNEQGLERALATRRLRQYGVLTQYCSETYAKKNVNRSNQEIVATFPHLCQRYRELGLDIYGIIIAAFGSNYDGEVPLSAVLATVDQFVRTAAEQKIRYERIVLADSFGWANPGQIIRVVGAVRERYPDLYVGLHLHDTRGTGMANLYAALSVGVGYFDTAIGGMGGSPFAKGAAGNIPTEDAAFLCEELGIDTGLDLDRLIECVQMAEAIVGHPLPGKLARGGSLTAFRRR
ncbi:MAG: hydroxymethylglutaryl-CoA lyase [Betaproteobacteria bacterium]|nr:MAG: hydroxymethylglutaryl-CoA lyase [Betaproteobacteria bacterium]